MSESFFTLREASATAGRFRLGPVTLDLPHRAWFVLLGASGSGKTTLLNLVAGVIPAPSGAITLDGRDLGPLPPERRRVGYVSQSGDLFPHLTVAGNVAFGLRFRNFQKKEQRDRVERLLALFGLEALADQRASTVSGGEGRRVALARSLAVEPVLLLLDEPLGMLDPESRAAMRDCLVKAHRELGTTTIHVTHDHEEARLLGDRFARMENGRLTMTEAP